MMKLLLTSFFKKKIKIQTTCKELLKDIAILLCEKILWKIRNHEKDTE